MSRPVTLSRRRGYSPTGHHVRLGGASQQIGTSRRSHQLSNWLRRPSSEISERGCAHSKPACDHKRETEASGTSCQQTE